MSVSIDGPLSKEQARELVSEYFVVGSPKKGGSALRSVANRFWARVNRRGPDECWLWGDRAGRSHIVMSTQGKSVRGIHRVSWELHNGPIPEGLCVCHHCDNPPCVNPAHLFLGTHQDNADDKVRKGRARGPNRNATHCQRGHAFSPENTGRNTNDGRYCRTCMRAAQARRKL